MNTLLAFVIGACALAVVQCMWVKEMENKGLFQGDIALDPDEYLPYGNGTLHGNGTITYGSMKGGRWPGGRVPYYIEGSIGGKGRRAIANAIAQYHAHTCLKFFPRTNERSYISFYRGQGCHSPVGYRNGRANRISLQDDRTGTCQQTGIVMHEMGHSIGFWHEQMRPDRDSYIKIIWGNIGQGMRSQFDKLTTRTIDSLGTPYDFSSIMHYGSTAFSVGGGRKTMVTIDPSKQHLIGQSVGFSEIDIRQIGLMYKAQCGGGGGGGGQGDCDNKNPRCEEWAKKGECGKHSGWMTDFCCKACKEFGSL